MTTPDPTKMEIRVRGAITLGNELVLRQGAQEQSVPDYYPLIPGSVLPPTEWELPRPTPQGDIDVRTIQYELAPGTGSVRIGGPGLVLQYGIVGKPGSGKTHLLMHLLRQIVAFNRHNPDRRYGGLILDPKAALIDDVRKVFREQGREEDLVVLNTQTLRENGGVNVIDCMLNPEDLGESLVLVARGAGLDAKEGYWPGQMASTFGAILTLLRFLDPGKKPTLERLMHFAVGFDRRSARPALDGLMKYAEDALAERAGDPREQDAFNALCTLKRYVGASDPKNRAIVEQFMEIGFKVFLDPLYGCYSEPTSAGASLYDRIINDGKMILVSTELQEVKLAAVLPALVKLIFQRTVISRFSRYKNWELHNCERPLLFLADEYHLVATHVDGKFGDAQFFSNTRQMGTLCFVATQSMQQLGFSSMKDAWKAVFDVLSAVIVMWGNDPETIEYANKLAGANQAVIRAVGHNQADGKTSDNVSSNLTELQEIPPGVLQLLKQGQAIVIGKTEGPNQQASVRFVQVPAH
jgi:hypothetical protein